MKMDILVRLRAHQFRKEIESHPQNRKHKKDGCDALNHTYPPNDCGASLRCSPHIRRPRYSHNPVPKNVHKAQAKPDQHNRLGQYAYINHGNASFVAETSLLSR